MDCDPLDSQDGCVLAWAHFRAQFSVCYLILQEAEQLEDHINSAREALSNSETTYFAHHTSAHAGVEEAFANQPLGPVDWICPPDLRGIDVERHLFELVLLGYLRALRQFVQRLGHNAPTEDCVAPQYEPEYLSQLSHVSIGQLGLLRELEQTARLLRDNSGVIDESYRSMKGAAAFHVGELRPLPQSYVHWATNFIYQLALSLFRECRQGPSQ